MKKIQFYYCYYLIKNYKNDDYQILILSITIKLFLLIKNNFLFSQPISCSGL